MKKTKNLPTSYRQSLIHLGLLAAVFALTGCSNMAKQLPLSDQPTTVDNNFGWSVSRMIEIQQRPMVGYGPIAGNQLEGWEAENIMKNFNNSN
ncbi:MAG: hypothetical protein ACPGVP_00620 [Thiolinea sp.]